MELKNAERGSCRAAEGAWKGVFTAGHPCNPFQGKYPSPGKGGGHSTFLVAMCGPDFQTWGACEWINYRESWGLWADFHQKTGVSDLIIDQISKLFDQNRDQIGASGAKIALFSENCWFWRQNFTLIFQMRILWTDLASTGGLVNGRRGAKR